MGKVRLLIIIAIFLSECKGARTTYCDDNIKTFVISGDNYYEKEEYKKALRYYKNAYYLDSTNMKVCFRLATCYAEIYETQKAILLYKESINSDFRKGDALFNIGMVYFRDLKTDSALKYYEKALKVLPDDQEIIYEIEHCKFLLGLQNTNNLE